MKTHHYGSQFNLIDNTYLESLLARLCQPETKQPEINRLIEKIYLGLIESVVNHLFPHETQQLKTRMNEAHPSSLLTAPVFRSETKAISVNLARAGTFPSHLCYDFLHSILPADNIRQDHIFAARKTDEAQKVTGTFIGCMKIGGPKDNAYVIFPDPMGATGGTLVSAIDHYEKEVAGSATAYIAIHLIVTPEYLKKVSSHSKKIQVFALRVDRGLSSPEILNTPLGQHWDREKGLNEKQYIVPGAGGLGELLNNAYV